MGLKSFFLFLISISFLVSSPSQALEKKLNAQVDYESFYYFTKLQSPTRTTDQVVHFEPSLDLKFNKRSRMIFKPHLRANLSTDETPEKAFINPKEMYWEIKSSRLRTRIGSNVHNWGAIDGYSPLDVTNGRALFNPLAAEKRGAAGLDLQYDQGKFQIQGLYIPYQSRTLLPSTDSRWLPRELLLQPGTIGENLLVPEKFNYYYPGMEGANQALQNNFGFKLSSRYDEWDFNAVFFEGSSITPQIRPIIDFDVISVDPFVARARNDIGLVPVYYRQQTVGGNIVWAPSDLIVRLESSYGKSRKDDPLIPAWIWQSALAVEKPIAIGASTLTLLVQTYYAENKDPIDNLSGSSNRIFDRAAVIGGRVAFPNDTNLLFTSLYNYRDDSYMVHVVVDTRVWDKFKLSLTGDMIEGSSGTLLGTYNKNDRVIAQLGYTW